MGYDTVSRLFHWVTAVLVLVMIPVGLTMAQEPPQPWQDRLYILHKGLGPLVLLVVLRGWAGGRSTRRRRLPASVSRPQQFAAGARSTPALYAAPRRDGRSAATSSSTPATTRLEALRALGVPPFIAKNEPLSKAAQAVHVTCAFVLIALIAMHVGAAAFHGLVKRDGVVSRMWPPVAPRRELAPLGAALGFGRSGRRGMLAGRRILLIIGGGIAAYKSLELIRLLQKAGAAVVPVLTAGRRRVRDAALGLGARPRRRCTRRCST